MEYGNIGILLIAEDPEWCEFVQANFDQFEVRCAASLAAARAFLEDEENKVDVILGEVNGIDDLDGVCAQMPPRPVVALVDAIDSTRPTPQNVAAYLLKDELSQRLAGHVLYSVLEQHRLKKAAHQAEGALAQMTRELQARNEELDAFAHAMAYDLQSPLSSIIGFGKLLRRMVPADEELLEYVNIIVQNAQKLTGLLNDLLLLNDVRKLDVQSAPLDMGGIVTRALKRLAPLVKDTEAEIRVPEVWPHVLGYAPWVEEVWVHYLGNAIKHGGRPPRVEVGASPAASSDQTSANLVRFWVRDNGPGLSLVDQDKVFVPLAKLGHVSDRVDSLELAVLQRAVEVLGGQVGVQSKAGLGSTFHFSLPEAVADAVA